MTYSPLTFLLGVLGVLNPYTIPLSNTTSCPAHLDVIGAGLSKTGTQSTKMAFEQLGYQVYNVESMMFHKHLELVTRIYETPDEETRLELIEELHDKILETSATVVLDIPCNVLFDGLRVFSPAAKVLLTVRDDAQKWVQSVQKTFHAFAPIVGWPFSFYFDIETYSRMLWIDEGCDHDVDIWEPWFMPWVKIAHRYYMKNEHKCMQMYDRHNHRVQSLVPESQLVVYNVKQGWDPLLDMVGKNPNEFPDLPEFPAVNRGSQMDTIGFVMRMIAYTYPILYVIGFCFYWMMVYAFFVWMACFEILTIL